MYLVSNIAHDSFITVKRRSPLEYQLKDITLRKKTNYILMKNLNINTVVFIKLFSLTLVLSVLTIVQNASAQLFFANFGGSQVKISNIKNNGQFAPITNQLSCEGKFMMINGELQYLNALKFNLSINLKNKDLALISNDSSNTLQPNNEINFELTHSMVLPELNMIHAIGYLAIQGVKTRVYFHLNYMENDNETITIMGKRAIKLSDYKKEPISIFADETIMSLHSQNAMNKLMIASSPLKNKLYSNEKEQDIIQLDLKLVIKNSAKTEYIAVLVK